MRQHTAPQTPTLSQAIAITLFTLSLTACTTTGADTAPHRGDEPTTGSADTAPIDVHAPATFDPKDPNFKLFDPCTELSEETFQQAGLGKRSRIGSNANDDYKYCGFRVESSNGVEGTVGVSMNTGNIDELRRKVEIVNPQGVFRQADVFQYRLNQNAVNECTTAATTSRGLLSITLLTYDSNLAGKGVCEKSLAFFEEIYPLVEKAIENGKRSN